MTAIGDGLLLVDKPWGPTSHDVVARIRAATGHRRAGHTGTLDPPATGLLVVLIGRATRLARFVPDAPKLYEGTFRLGITTATDDLAGAVTARHDGPLPAFAEIRAGAARFLGRQWQLPPAVSARKVAGVRLYELARKGAAAVEAPPSAVVVGRFEIGATTDACVCSFAAEVSTGTYVRALVRDLGRDLGCGAAVASLRRTAIGPFDVRDAVALPPSGPPDLREIARRLTGLEALPLTVPSVILEEGSDAKRFHAGVRLPRPPGAPSGEGEVAVRGPDGGLLGIGTIGPGGLAPRVVLSGAAGD